MHTQYLWVENPSKGTTVLWAQSNWEQHNSSLTWEQIWTTHTQTRSCKHSTYSAITTSSQHLHRPQLFTVFGCMDSVCCSQYPSVTPSRYLMLTQFIFWHRHNIFVLIHPFNWKAPLNWDRSCCDVVTAFKCPERCSPWIRTQLPCVYVCEGTRVSLLRISSLWRKKKPQK